MALFIFATQSGNVPASELDSNFAAMVQTAGHAPFTLMGNNTGGTGPVVDLTPTQVYAFIHGYFPVDLNAFMGGPQVVASQMIYRYQPIFNINYAGGANIFASAGVASTGTAVFSINKNGVQIGTVTFTSSATGVASLSAFSLGGSVDLLTITGPATADGTLADVNITIVMAR